MSKKHCTLFLLSLLLIGSVIGISQPNVVAQVEEPLFTLHFMVPTESPTQLSIAELIKDAYAEFGIEVIIDVFEAGTFYSRGISQSGETGKMLTHDEGGYDMSYMNYIFPYSVVDYIFYLGCYAAEGIPPLGWNFWASRDSTADIYLRNAMATYDKGERIDWMHKWQDRYQEIATVLNLAYPEQAIIRRKEVMNYSEVYLGYDVGGWYIEGEEDATLRFALGAVQPMLNPWFIDGGYMPLAGLWRSVFQYKEVSPGTFDIVPDMAKGWDLSEDGLTLTINLRQGITYSDGVEMTAKDVKFTYDSILDPATGSTVQADMAACIDSVEMLDDYTIVLHLKKVSPELFTLLACVYTMILPSHQLGDVPRGELRTHWSNTERPAVGTGPFKFVEWVRGEYFQVERNPTYYGTPSRLQTVFYLLGMTGKSSEAALLAGEADVMYTSLAQQIMTDWPTLIEDPNIEVESGFQTLMHVFIALNNDHPILSNMYVRQALAWMTPYDDIIETVYLGNAEPANGPCHPLSWGWNPDTPYYTYNPEKAREALAKAGYPSWPITEPPTETPMTSYLVPAVAGLAVGLAIGIGATIFISRKR